MRKIILPALLVSMSFVSQAQAITLNCSQSELQSSRGDDDSMLAVFEHVSMDCSDNFHASIFGLGLGLRHAVDSITKISCVGAQDPRGIYLGMKSNIGLVYGVGRGLFAGPTGTCLLEIRTGGVGVSLSQGVLTIR